MSTRTKSSQGNSLQEALRETRSALSGVFFFSCFVNILMLTGPLFMLQVYDRVLASKSVPTLIALFSLVIGSYMFLGFFDFLRQRIMARVGYRLDNSVMADALKMWITQGQKTGQNQRPVAQLSTIRQFVNSPGPLALFDLPWVPFYLLIVFMLHPWLGYLAILGASIGIIVTIANELLTRNVLKGAAQWDMLDQSFSEKSFRAGSTIVSMGMSGNIANYWRKLRTGALSQHQRAGNINEITGTISKTTRMVLQSGILAMGAWLVIRQELSAGSMITASILSGRALAPIDMAIGNWKNLIRARQAYASLSQAMKNFASDDEKIALPDPLGALTVGNMTKLKSGANDGEDDFILKDINFSLRAGDGLLIVGPSASGKSSLTRLLVGLWMPDKGAVRLDGAEFDQWDSDDLGKFIGYLPQKSELLPGSIKQNISRFNDDVSDEDIIAAAQLVDVHEMILRLPKGYATVIDEFSSALSGGQLQRVALARALLLQPKLIVLDEPHISLDIEGRASLQRAITNLRKNGSTVIVTDHQPGQYNQMNKMLRLDHGQQVSFENLDEPPKQRGQSKVKITKLVPNAPILIKANGAQGDPQQ